MRIATVQPFPDIGSQRLVVQCRIEFAKRAVTMTRAVGGLGNHPVARDEQRMSWVRSGYRRKRCRTVRGEQCLDLLIEFGWGERLIHE